MNASDLGVFKKVFPLAFQRLKTLLQLLVLIISAAGRPRHPQEKEVTSVVDSCSDVLLLALRAVGLVKSLLESTTLAALFSVPAALLKLPSAQEHAARKAAVELTCISFFEGLLKSNGFRIRASPCCRFVDAWSLSGGAMSVGKAEHSGEHAHDAQWVHQQIYKDLNHLHTSAYDHIGRCVSRPRAPLLESALSESD